MREFWQGFWCSIVLAGGWLAGYWYGVGHENWPYEFKLALLEWGRELVRLANHVV